MARKIKTIMENGIDKREVGYYSTPSFVAKYLTHEMLSINPNGASVLDPAVGREELLEEFYKAGKTIDSYDIIKHCEYRMSNFCQRNFIEVYADFVNNNFFSTEASHYDYMIANPPYIDSETMERTMPEMRRIYKELYSTASGNWDMFILFVEKGNRLLKNNGVQSYIVPNKLIAAKYADALRNFMVQQNIFIIRDYGSVPVFEAFVYPCVFVLGKQVNDQPVKFETMSNLSDVDSSHIVDRKIFNRDTLWDKYFIDTDKLNIVLSMSSHQCLSEVVSQICGSATVAEAYLVKEALIDEWENDNLKFINTGTIDKYTSLWGIKDTQYIKGKYHTPSISKTSLQRISDRRLVQSMSNKIIVAGMSKEIEAFYDEGEYLAGKSTTIIMDDSIQLKFIYAILNSKLLTFWVRINFNSLKMSGGFINVGVNELSQIPIADCKSIKNTIVDLIDLIIVRKKINSEADTSDLENQIDLLVYKLYYLTYDEVLIVDPETPITREEYEQN